MPTTNYIWDVETDSYLMETDGSDVTQAVYTAEPKQFGRVVSQRRSSTTNYLHQDALGSTRQLTDSTKTSTDTWIYESWGSEKARTGVSVLPFQSKGAFGYYSDSETVLQYVRWRHYDSSVARWTAVDPLGFVDGPNSYRPVSNNPLYYVDPSGLAPPWVSPRPQPSAQDGFNQEPWIPSEEAQDERIRVWCFHLLREALLAANGAWILPRGANRCHRWVETARDRIVALGNNAYDNRCFKITYIDWRFPPQGGWIDHAGLKITFKEDSVLGKAGDFILLDNGTISGSLISRPNQIPENWWASNESPLFPALGCPGYCTWEDLKALPRAIPERFR